MHQRPQRRAGLPFGAGLQVTAEQDERDDPGRHLQVDRGGGVCARDGQVEPVAHAGHARVAQEQGPQRPAERGQRAERHQRVHGGRAVPEIGPGGAVEGLPAPDDDGCGEGEAQPLPEVELERGDHGEQDHGDGQCGGDDEPLPECGEGGVLLRLGVPCGGLGGGFPDGVPGRLCGGGGAGGGARGPFRTRAGGGGSGGGVGVRGGGWGRRRARVRRRGGVRGAGRGRSLPFGPGDRAGRVAGLLDRGDEVPEFQPLPEGDAGLLGRVVHRGGDAVHPVELLLDAGGARGAGHPADDQLGLGGLGGREVGFCCAGHVRDSWNNADRAVPHQYRLVGQARRRTGIVPVLRCCGAAVLRCCGAAVLRCCGAAGGLRRPGRAARTRPRPRRRARRPRPAGPWRRR